MQLSRQAELQTKLDRIGSMITQLEYGGFSSPVEATIKQQRRSKNGTPEERAAKKTAATVIDVTSRLARRAAATRATKGDPMTKEEFAIAYANLTPAQKKWFDAKVRDIARQSDLPDKPA